MNQSTYKNRGMFLENIINDSNNYYNEIERCLIYKKPTPIKVLNVTYPTNKTHLINKAVYSSVSTLDYNGIYRGKYIEFDAKMCNNKSLFPISNIKNHQINHIKQVIKQGGIAFLIIMINNEIFLLKGEDLINIINDNKKYITYKYFKEYAYIINESYIPRLKYLDVVDKIYFEE